MESSWDEISSLARYLKKTPANLSKAGRQVFPRRFTTMALKPSQKLSAQGQTGSHLNQ
jgi:hypothetical protein